MIILFLQETLRADNHILEIRYSNNLVATKEDEWNTFLEKEKNLLMKIC